MTTQFDPLLLEYLAQSGPKKLRLAASAAARPGWLTAARDPADQPTDGSVFAADPATDLLIPSGSFDCIYIDRLLERLPLDAGMTLIEECHRILKPGGLIRIVTPALGFLLRLLSPDRRPLEQHYVDWCVHTFAPHAPAATNAIFLNSVMRSAGHVFLYDAETLRLALNTAGFAALQQETIGTSQHEPFRGLENPDDPQPGFAALGSMVFEAVRTGPAIPAPMDETPVSRGKRAMQSSVSPAWSQGKTPADDAKRALNGELAPDYNCHTEEEDAPWWWVDLGRIHNITQIRIYNRVSARFVMERLSRFAIQFSLDGAQWDTVFTKETASVIRGLPHNAFTWQPDTPIDSARFVRIQKTGHGCLHVRQIEVFGAPKRAPAPRHPNELAITLTK